MTFALYREVSLTQVFFLELTFVQHESSALLLEIHRMAGSIYQLAFLELRSFVRGYHAYQTLWNSDVLCLERELMNSKDRFAIAVMDAGSRVAGHVPFNLAPTVSNFLKEKCEQGNCVSSGAVS